MTPLLAAESASLAVVALVISLLLSAASPRRGEAARPRLFLAMAFLEILLALAPEVATKVGLSLPRAYRFLGFANYFLGSTSLYLYAASTFRVEVGRPIRYYAPTLVNLLPALAFSVSRPAPIQNLYTFALLGGELLLLAVYGTWILRLLRDQSRTSRGLPGRELCLRMLACYAGYYLLTLAVLVASLAARALGRPSTPRWLELTPLGFIIAASAFVSFSLLRGLTAARQGHDEASPKPKYGGTALPEGRGEEILADARRFLAGSEDLGDEAAGPRALAAGIGVPYYLLSRAANEAGGLSVGELIAEARVERAKRLLVAKPGRDLMAIAFDSGFGAKSSFNAAFKKWTGLSPSEYRERALREREREG